ncbi:MAG TPA: tail fiber domain-containing protein [Methylomirabilota bacterium]|nr:tail fiber domain-containing protein [Methylomirabilota bacterium]
MKIRKLLARLGLAAVLLSTINLQLSTASAQGTAFTYQGVLSQNGVAVSGSNDLTFTLYNAASAGATVGTSNVVSDLRMTNGLFTVTLDFGAGAFDGTARWLEIAARPGASTGAYTNLAPRQSVTPTPYAIYAGGASATGLIGTVPSSALAANVALRDSTNLFVGDQVIRQGNLRVQFNTGLGADPHPVHRLFVGGTVSAGSYLGDGSQLANIDAATYIGPVADNQLTANIARRTGGNTFNGQQIITNGNIGLGTATPNNLLDVAAGGVIGSSAVTGANGHDPLNRGTKVSFGYNILGSELNGMRAVVNPSTTGCGNSGDLLFYTWECNTAASREVMQINGSGYVGIGTTSPSEKLHVSGNVFASGNVITIGDIFADGDVNAGLNVHAGANIVADGEILAGSKAGIGTINPATTLDVRSATPEITVGTVGNTGGALYFGNSGHGVKRGYSQINDVGLYTTAADIYLSANGPTTSQFVLKNNGNVGIGTNNPTAKLNVVGNARIDGRLNVNNEGSGDTTMMLRMFPGDQYAKIYRGSAGNNLLVIGDPVLNDGVTFGVLTGAAIKPGGGSWGAVSDARAKKNVHKMEGALSRLLALRSVTYEYKDPTAPGAKAGTQNGFIAQEVEPLFPDWVSTDAKGMKMLSISGFESLTVAALRELQAEKDAQFKKIEAQNAKLQEQNQSLEQRVAALEKLINRLSVTKEDAR